MQSQQPGLAVCACGFVAAASEVSKALEQASVAPSGNATTNQEADMDDDAETSRRELAQVPPQEQEQERAGLKPQVLGSHSPSPVRGLRGVQRVRVCAANDCLYTRLDRSACLHTCMCWRVRASLRLCVSPLLSLPLPPSLSLSPPPPPPRSIT